jgi:RNA polymerase sigma-70 factor, ECF subfamily
VSNQKPSVKKSAVDARVMAATKGDDVALSALMRAYQERVYRYGVRVCRDPFDADDAVQEAFSKLAHRTDVQQSPTALSWLMSVVRNACFRMMRPFARQRRALGSAIDDEIAIPSLQPSALEALLRWQLVQAVHECITQLERPYREVLILRDIEGMSGSQTCDALGLETAAMKSRLHRARMLLRDALAQRQEVTGIVAAATRDRSESN